MAPRFWFVRAEGEFTTKGITDSALKFHYVAGALPQDVALHVMPTLEEEADYDNLKQELLFAYELKNAQRGAKLLHLPDLGDKLPSTLAAKIVALVPKDATPGYLEHQIFFEQLPQTLQAHMAAHTEVTDLCQLAKIAEQYMASPGASSSSSSFTVM